LFFLTITYIHKKTNIATTLNTHPDMSTLNDIGHN